MNRDAAGTGQHVFVVDDEPAARDLVADYLRLHGFKVTPCDGGAAMREALKSGTPDLVVLDLNMPQEDGLSVIRDLKRRTDVPVIMLTATASPVDRIVGLELGADDYVAKPCELRELLARIRSILRRARPAPAPPPAAAAGAGANPDLVRFGTKWLDLAAHALREEDGAEIALTLSEFNLLKVFAANPRRVLTRERLLDLAEARDADVFDRSIDVRITRLRKKIEPDPREPTIIRTVRGVGYLYAPDGKEP